MRTLWWGLGCLLVMGCSGADQKEEKELVKVEEVEEAKKAPVKKVPRLNFAQLYGRPFVAKDHCKQSRAIDLPDGWSVMLCKDYEGAGVIPAPSWMFVGLKDDKVMTVALSRATGYSKVTKEREDRRAAQEEARLRFAALEGNGCTIEQLPCKTKAGCSLFSLRKLASCNQERVLYVGYDDQLSAIYYYGQDRAALDAFAALAGWLGAGSGGSKEQVPGSFFPFVLRQPPGQHGNPIYTRPVPKPKDVKRFETMEYRLFAWAPLSWSHAQTICHAMRGDLAVAKTKEQFEFLSQMVKARGHDAWLGARACKMKKPTKYKSWTYCWSGGQELSFPYANPYWVRNGQVPREDSHVFMRGSGELSGNMDFARRGVQGFICQWPAPKE